MNMRDSIRNLTARLMMEPVGTVYVSRLETFTKTEEAVYSWAGMYDDDGGFALFTDREVAICATAMDEKEEPWCLL